MRDNRSSASNVSLPARSWAFVAVCASAGALAVPLHAVASPVSAIVAGLGGLLGLRVWRWSRLPSSVRLEAPHGVERIVRPTVSLGLGLIVGQLLLVTIRLAIEPSVPAAGARIAAAGALPLWRRAVMIYVAAVGEELLFRLLLMSLIAGLIIRFTQRADQTPSLGIIWVANGLSALAFAAVHLPAWRALGSLNVNLAFVVLALNSLGGIVFGCLFAKRGITAAMWAHAGADCAIQLIGPLT